MADTKQSPAEQKENTKPVRVFRAFGVKVSVFANRTKTGDEERVFHKVTVQRIYRDGEKFKTTSSLSRHDLPAAWVLLQKAWEYIGQAESSPSAKVAMA
jgi:hypothetical protein